MTTADKIDAKFHNLMRHAKNYAEVVDEVATAARSVSSCLDSVMEELEIEATHDDKRVGDLLLRCRALVDAIA